MTISPLPMGRSEKEIEIDKEIVRVYVNRLDKGSVSKLSSLDAASTIKKSLEKALWEGRLDIVYNAHILTEFFDALKKRAAM